MILRSGLVNLGIQIEAPALANGTSPICHFVAQPAAPIRENLTKLGIVLPTFQFSRTNVTSLLYMKFWIPVLATALLAAAFGIRRPYRFSLRALLIATTLIAVVLGAIVWAVK
jgi:hypothetical protein